MSTIIDDVDYGPLAQLIGQWIGTKGLDIAPDAQAEPDESPYTDELTYTAAGPAENAEEQQLVAVRYHHTVRKNENGLIFHDQIGHWLYEPETGLIMHSFTIPRGVCVLAGGQIETAGEKTILNVKATAGEETFGIVQSPFMLEKAKTKAFEMEMIIAGNTLSYKQTTSLFIYGKDFDHIDESNLQRVRYDSD
jgi:hypothetical protein